MTKFRFLLTVVLMITAARGLAREYHVSVKGSDRDAGTISKPFRTINFAAQMAVPGDHIVVHEGIYRERINPPRGGINNSTRIVYKSAQGEKAEIRGSEIIKGWAKEKDGTWKVVIPNTFFGDYNPYLDSIHGDWFTSRGRIHHTGEVFLNGKSLFEKETPEKMIHPEPDTKIQDTEGSTYTWYCSVDAANTTIRANFHQFDPNSELVEISTRKTCFYPEKPGINYLTIDGFRFSQAATQWGAPTAGQVGMIATHWNKGWIIENNVISDSKCSGITLGKESGTGHNVWTADKENINRDGNIHYIEVLFRVLRNGWNKENIGSHIVRNNTIFNCEQTGICGSMGGAFCIIENNHIYNIWTKRQFSGAEIGGIKFHAAVDTQIRNNRIHHAGRGLWLDWMTQGTRVSSNLFYGNSMEDIFLEVNHGPFVVDNNILLSDIAIRTQSQGGAYLHNLVAGAVYTWPESGRFTPYFLPHSTDIGALMTIQSGDDRYYNNVFIGRGKPAEESKYKFGLEGYNGAKLPVWMSGNIYYNEAKPSVYDLNYIDLPSFDPGIKLVEEGGNCFLLMKLSPEFYTHGVRLITSGILGNAKIPKAPFDNPDGSVLTIDTDYLGAKRSAANPAAGPFEHPEKGELKLKVWQE